MAKLPRQGGDMIRPEQAVEARDSLVDTLLQTNKQTIPLLMIINRNVYSRWAQLKTTSAFLLSVHK